jgi:hypothetical protein
MNKHEIAVVWALVTVGVVCLIGSALQFRYN